MTNTFRDAVNRHGLTGAVFAPLLLNGSADRWFLMGVTGRCGPFDYSASQRFERVIPKVVGGESRVPYLRGFTLDLDRWSGDDFALPARVNRTLVTQRVVDGLGAEGLTNVLFTPIGEYEIAERTVGSVLSSPA